MKMLNLSFLIYLSTITSFTLSLNEETDLRFDDKWKSGIKVKLNRTRISATNATVNNCGLSHFTETIGNKIVGGREAILGEFPWQVLLKITMLIEGQYREVQCGGSLLSETWVLTAAHCVSDESNGEPTAQQIQISAGIRNRNAIFESGATRAQVKFADCVIQHENWRGQDGNFLYDLALIRVPTMDAFRFTYREGGVVNNVCLPPIKNPPFEYTGIARISGWGLTRDGGSPSDILKYTDVTILNNKVCLRYPYPVPIASSMLCQGVDRTSPCQGDSGGPLIIHMGDQQPAIQIGIVSFGPGQCANSEIPNAIYTKISYYRNWIDSIIQEYSGNADCGARALKIL